MELEEPGWRGRVSPATVVFLASFAGLFLELALIRWVSSEIRVFSYCKNLVLVACFLGFGVGCMQMRRRENLVRSMFLLLLLILVVDLQSQSLLDFGPRRVTDVLARLSGMMIFHFPTEEMVWGVAEYGWLLFSLAWTGVPEGTESLAITMHHFPNSNDTDLAKANQYLLLWGIDPSVSEIAHGAADDGAWFMGSDKDGTRASYTSPCSQSTGTHAYTITIYALAETPASLPQESTVEVSLTVLQAAIESVTELGRTTLNFNDVTN